MSAPESATYHQDKTWQLNRRVMPMLAKADEDMYAKLAGRCEMSYRHIMKSTIDAYIGIECLRSLESQTSSNIEHQLMTPSVDSRTFMREAHTALV